MNSKLLYFFFFFMNANGNFILHFFSLLFFYIYIFINVCCCIDRNGLNIRGYIVWSFLDVFELIEGYELSYGLYYIDFEDPTLRRQPKLSAKWYSNFLNNRTMDSKITMKMNENSSLFSNAPLMHIDISTS